MICVLTNYNTYFIQNVIVVLEAVLFLLSSKRVNFILNSIAFRQPDWYLKTIIIAGYKYITL